MARPHMVHPGFSSRLVSSRPVLSSSPPGSMSSSLPLSENITVS
ncbi:hypothetical protein GQ607_000359 [Colletotrichum asianum]|uniref:Uncharacterized protein n=1 Tax=Colletotrichum asianum TaxID=702518 RepID=A0A8H3WVN9_9PEZI|nr:hypothetical protein GQ607_000359 [Colletotrichum asianum]